MNVRTNCLKCGGKGTLYTLISKGKRKYHCFKPGCKNSGIELLELDADALRDYNIENIFKGEGIRKEYLFSAVENSCKCMQLLERYGIEYLIDDCSTTVAYDPVQERLVFGYKDLIIGRALDKGSAPKWYRYSGTNTPYHLRPRNSPHLIIVEDCISAAVVAKTIDCMALLGTSMIDAYYPYLLKRSGAPYRNIYIALDKDATGKAIEIARDLSYISPTRVTILERDLKELTAEELRLYFRDWGIVNG